MDHMPLPALFLQSIPEGVVLISLGLVLVGVRPRPVPVAVVAAAESVALYFIRILPLPFGVHTVVAVALIAVGLRAVAGLAWWRALAASVAGTSLLVVTEGLCLPVVTQLFGVRAETVLATLWLRVVFPLPYEAVLALVGWWCWRRRWSLFPREEGGSGDLV